MIKRYILTQLVSQSQPLMLGNMGYPEPDSITHSFREGLHKIIGDEIETTDLIKQAASGHQKSLNKNVFTFNVFEPALVKTAALQSQSFSKIAKPV